MYVFILLIITDITIMSLKTKIMNVITTDPKLVTFGIDLVIIFGVVIVSGIVEVQQAHALVFDQSGQFLIQCGCD